ncbi:MAG: hypothetical protein ACXAC7_20405 [Candidatus Hodarchaeales archaeon]|jgi:hypothetical protein
MDTLARSDPKQTVLLILEDLGEASTAEIIEEAALLSNECKDRVPRSLLALYRDGKVNRRISKEKKAILWSLDEVKK